MLVRGAASRAALPHRCLGSYHSTALDEAGNLGETVRRICWCGCLLKETTP
jgi:hypothetical protein